MQHISPLGRDLRRILHGSDWLLPATILALALAVYFRAHGVAGSLDITAAIIAALGVIGASVAAPRWIRGRVIGEPRTDSLLASGPSVPDVAPPPAPGRRIVAVAIGAAISSAEIVVLANLLGTVDSSTAGHAVLGVALYANLAVLLSNATPIPPWPGWTLLLAVVDHWGLTAADRMDRAIAIARGVIVAEAAALAAVAFAGSDWGLLGVPALLIWHVWIQTAMARSDDLIDRYLTTRRLGAVAQPFTTTVSPDEPALVGGERRPSARAVMAVTEGGAFLGAIGPRQFAAVPPAAPWTSSRDLMIPADELELLRVDAPATTALPQLQRYGFAIVSGSGSVSYVQVDDLLQRILMAAAVARAVHDLPGDTSDR